MITKRKPKYTKKDFQVGQTAYIEQNAASSAYMVDTVGKIKEEVVEKVGTTYVTTSSQNRYSYEDGLIADAYSKDYCLHLTREQAEISALTRKLKRTILVTTKLYKVGSKVFKTKEEAESYIKEQEIEKLRQNSSQVSFPFTPTIYYENLVSTDDRGNLQIKARWFSLDDAVAAMDNYADYFREKGTGSIRKVTISLSDNPSQGTVSVHFETVVRK